MSLLERIVLSKRQDIARLRASGPPPPRTAARRDVLGALRRPPGAPLRLITEVKLRSPSAGALSTALPPAARAVAYATSGAVMISVLCDGPFFDGSWDHLEDARRALDAAGHDALVLAKEFVLDVRQIEEADARGADAVLLIARILGEEALDGLARAALDRGLEPLVEVVDEPELERALAAGARVVGVNARDLDTLGMAPARAARVLRAIPHDRVAVHLSGLKGPGDVRAVAASRADAALVGEALMREDDPRALLAAMLEATRT